MAFVTFATESETRAAFKKSESLKINGGPVDVFYARIIPSIFGVIKKNWIFFRNCF